MSYYPFNFPKNQTFTFWMIKLRRKTISKDQNILEALLTQSHSKAKQPQSNTLKTTENPLTIKQHSDNHNRRMHTFYVHTSFFLCLFLSCSLNPSFFVGSLEQGWCGNILCSPLWRKACAGTALGGWWHDCLQAFVKRERGKKQQGDTRAQERLCFGEDYRTTGKWQSQRRTSTP